MSERALTACREYECWATAIRRLTERIGEVTCPKQSVEQGANVGPLVAFTTGESCFGEVASEVIGGDFERGPRRRSLDEIEPMVAACPACSQLVKLIRARKHARQRFGVAKRAVRSAGKIATSKPSTEETHD